MRFAFEQVNETQKTLSTAFASGEERTLADLLASADRDWSLRSSQPPSLQDDEATEMFRASQPDSRPPPRW